MNWHERYQKMKSGLEMTDDDISTITGLTPGSLKQLKKPSVKIPKWLKFAIVVYEKRKKNK